MAARAINREAIKTLKRPWLEDTPYDIRDAAMDDLLKAFHSGLARYKSDKKNFKIRYRSGKKCFQESIVIHSKHWAHGSGKYAFLRHMKSAEKLPEKLSSDSRLVMERSTGHFYLCLPGPLEMVEGPTGVPRVISLDPGVRSFMTGYTPDGEVVELGKGDIGHIYRLCHRMDDLQSRYSAKGLDQPKEVLLQFVQSDHSANIPNAADDWQRTSQDSIQDSESHGHLGPLPVPEAPYGQGKGVQVLQSGPGQRGTHKQNMWSMWASEQRWGQQGIQMLTLRACLRPGHQRGEEHPDKVLYQGGRRG
ncbi:hypothetical protein V1517DRAFT_332509, partial [Lipomyces orientalis]